MTSSNLNNTKGDRCSSIHPDKGYCTKQEHHELAQLARKLRRVKRRMLLQYVEEPKTQSDRLRALLVKKASEPQIKNMEESKKENIDANSLNASMPSRTSKPKKIQLLTD